MSDRAIADNVLTDEQLIAEFQQGNNEAFTLLVGRYKDQLVNFLYRYLGDYDEADDVAQETFLRLYSKKDRYKPIAKFSTWLYTIATNLAKTQLRRRKRLTFFSFQQEDDDDRRNALPDNRYPADAEADRFLKNAMIQRALNSLSPKYREVLVLSDIQELSYEEICSITGLNIGTVKSRLNRGRSRMQVLLKDLHDE
jgi:RNA polymerase sigma-70 factor (ECF subfamily)